MAKRKSLLPEIFNIECPFCGHKTTYSRYDVYEEVIVFNCPVCGGPFYIVPRPPLTVKCPHCQSKLRITDNNRLSIIEKNDRIWVSKALLGALIGAFFGGVMSGDKAPLGAIAGGIAGGILGSLLDQKEAIYIDK